MEKNWKKIITKAKDSTVDAFGKGRNMLTIQNHKSAINGHYQDIGRVVFELSQNEEKKLFSNYKEIQSIIEDIEYRMKKISELSKE